jgi:photosystem II stability/assembly factor-like uncharacterized protein
MWTSHDKSAEVVNDVSASATDPNIVFAVFGQNGLESTHDGRHWKQFLIPGSANDFLSVAVAPSDPDVVYVASPQIFRTGDGGTTWTRAGGAGSVRKVAVDPLDANTVWVANNHGKGVHVSTDGGVSWQQRKHGLPGGGHYIDTTAIELDPTAPGTAYVGVYSYGIFKTTNYGKSWKRVNTPVTPEMHVFDIAIDPADPNVMIAAMDTATYRTDDGGATWSMVTGLRFSVTFDPADPSLVYAVFGDVQRSKDGGLTWHPYNQGLGTNESARAITIDGAGQTLHVATNDGVWDRSA